MLFVILIIILPGSLRSGGTVEYTTGNSKLAKVLIKCYI